ncbi:MAG: hypothetical protein WD335_02230 [Candidatus Paceibacterota bacterium]
MAQYRNGKTIAWAALIISIAALVLAWMSYTQADSSMLDTSSASDDNTIQMRTDFQATEEELLGDDSDEENEPETGTSSDTDQE